MCAKNKNEEAIFNAATEIDSPAERAAFVKSACGDDTELLARVEGLLKVHYEDDSFLKSLPADPPCQQGKKALKFRPNAQAKWRNLRIKCASWSEKLQKIGKNLQKLVKISKNW